MGSREASIRDCDFIQSANETQRSAASEPNGCPADSHSGTSAESVANSNLSQIDCKKKSGAGMAAVNADVCMAFLNTIRFR